MRRRVSGGAVAKADWGTKRICPNCGTRYYDMRRDPVTCPKCGAPFDAETLVRTRKSRAAAPVEAEEVPIAEEELEADLAAEPEAETVVEVAVPAVAIVAGEAEEEVEAVEGEVVKKEEEEDEAVLEDASELGEDEDDMAEVIENVDDDDER
ncbi:MAG TPA: TIGR02300 family protein [Stellaceae bacterium]|nr:TIGR02300 family protein [Stellaceae bacterium]